MPTRYLTKSQFRLALECPTKLFYTGKDEYSNQTLNNTFLAELANGGFQVGELAKCYYPGGIEISSKNADQAIAETDKLLDRENVTIFEAAFRHKDFFIRTDILVKSGPRLVLIEVKAKSCDFADETGFHNKNGTIKSDWLPYMEDVAFQKYVISKSKPELTASAYLMLSDKTALCATDGLNQKFRLATNSEGRKSIKVSADLNEEDLSVKMLRLINVDGSCDKIYDGTSTLPTDPIGFEELTNLFAYHYVRDTRIVSPLSAGCRSCEFRHTAGDADQSLKSGFQECWKNGLNWQDSDFEDPNVLDIWNFSKKNKLIAEGRVKMSSITESDITAKSDGKPGLSNSERQWLQVKKATESDADFWFDAEGLRDAMKNWIYPLHFIDFETAMPAIPFKKGRRPYEGIAFQFSHHVVHEDGRVEHRGEYLNSKPGSFPNYDFVRALREQLEQDEGSIFRYHAHENTYLNLIYRQLRADANEIPDRDELCEFIKTITKSTSNSTEEWVGSRNMIDLYDLVKRYYFDPATKGSISIKDVLPAVLNSSEFLQEKYSVPIYGADNGIKSRNFKNWKWVEFDNGQVRDPYKSLPKLFTDESEHDYEILISDMDAVNDGGAAMTAYGKLQFQEMSAYERSEIEKALLKYCELDTLAMVMIYEAWRSMLL